MMRNKKSGADVNYPLLNIRRRERNTKFTSQKLYHYKKDESKP